MICTERNLVNIPPEPRRPSAVRDWSTPRCVQNTVVHAIPTSLTRYNLGAGGGNELWVQNLLDQLAVLYRHENDEDMPFELHQTFRDAINGVRNKIMGGISQCVAGLHPQTGQVVSFPVTKEMSDKAYETAFQHLKIMITGQLKRLASIKNGWGARTHSITIIMSGGSCLHPSFAKWMKALCEELSLPEPLSTHSMEIQYW